MRNMSQNPEPPLVARPYFGRTIRGLRRARGLTLVQLSERSGLSVPFLSQVENDRAMPSAQSLAAIADCLDASVCDIESAARGHVFADIERASAIRGNGDRPLGVLGGQVRFVEMVRQAGEGEDWQRHVHGIVLYVVAGHARVFTHVGGVENGDVLGPGDRIQCGPGTAYRWCAEGGGATVLAVRVDDRVLRAH